MYISKYAERLSVVKARANKGSCAWNASSMWFCNQTEKWIELQNGSGWWSFAHNECMGRNETLSLLPKERYFLFPQNEIDRPDKHSTVKSLIGYWLLLLCSLAWFHFTKMMRYALFTSLPFTRKCSIDRTYTLMWMAGIFRRIWPEQIYINCNHFLCYVIYELIIPLEFWP